MKGGRAKPNLPSTGDAAFKEVRVRGFQQMLLLYSRLGWGGTWMTVGVPQTDPPSLWKEELLSFQAPSPGTRGTPQAHRGFQPPSTSCCSSTAEAAHKPLIQGICSAVSTRHVHDGHACCLMKRMINAVKTQCDHGQIGFPH